MNSKTLAACAAMIAGPYLAVPVNAQSDNTAKELHPLVGILVEYIEVEQATATKLLRGYRSNGDATTLRDEVEKMVEKKNADIIETSYLVTRSGQRAKIESITEFIYPTEFDPAEIPQQLTGPIEKGADITTPVNPTAFEMRPVGTTLEVDPVVRAGAQFIDVNVAPEIVQHLHNETWGVEEAASEQPVFYSMKLSTATTLKPGGYCLLGVQTPRQSAPPLYLNEEEAKKPQAKDLRVMVFLRATVLELAPAGDEKANAEKAGE